ncbi:MAG: ATP-binding cassette domain-containing protein [Chloroflexota bacterium]
MIDVQNLTKDYGTYRALKDITFKVERGEILGFLGPNGAGKTTTMRILTGYMPASGGSVSIAGFDTFKQSVEARRHVGYLPETVPLYPEMSVQSYLDFMCKVKGIARGTRRDEIERVMGATHITDRASTLLHRLSKGYRQRVGLAQALLGSPDVLILDEPTAGLDPNQIQDVRSLIKGFGGDHTVILSTHILPEVEMICSRVLIIDEGRIKADDTPANLTRQLRGSESVEVEVRGARSDVLKVLRGVARVSGASALDDGKGAVGRYQVSCELGADVREDVARALVQGGFGVLGLRQSGLSLEDIFVRLTTDEADGRAA